MLNGSNLYDIMFSIVIPYYNKIKYIERCIESVLNQTFNKYEIILIDDGSTDGGSDFIQSKYGELVTVITQSNSGVSAARNLGIKKAKYPYIAFLDADDFWNINYLNYVAKLIEKEKEIKIIGSHYSRNKELVLKVNDNLSYYKIENYFKIAVRNTMFFTSAVVINAEFFNENSAFNTTLKRGEDTDVWIRTVASGGNVYYIENTLVYYSDEDENQATNTKTDIDKTLVGTINKLYQPLFEKYKNKKMEQFVSQYVYFNLYSYYYDEKYYEKAKLNLNENKFKYFWLHIVYNLPFSFGNQLIESKKYSKYIRLYLKFVTRYVTKIK